jgi:hypothetical protein
MNQRVGPLKRDNIGKTLAKIKQRKGVKTQINKIRDKKGDKIDVTEMQKMNREYSKNLYARNWKI